MITDLFQMIANTPSVLPKRKKTPSPVIFDCFTFFNELDILDMRLETHHSYIDYFVIVESTRTFTGLPKELHFANNKARFSKFAASIIHVVIEDMPVADDPFVREHFQRNQLVRGLTQAKPGDLVLISDVDELLRESAVEAAARFDGYSEFDMPMYQFYLNLQERGRGWTAAYATRFEYLDRIPNLSLARWDRSFRASFEAEGRYQVVTEAGWHFTHLGGIDRLKTKFQSYSHNADPWPRAMMRDGVLEKHITAGGIVGNFKERTRFVAIDGTYPETILARQGHYTALGFIKDVYEALSEIQDDYRALRNGVAVRLVHDPGPQDALFGVTVQDYMTMADLAPPFPGWTDTVSPFPGRLVSLGKPADQSSLSPWSHARSTLEEAAVAVNGRKTGGAAFHTDLQHRPWWMVDLLEVLPIRGLRIYNRMIPLDIALRSAPLCVEAGPDMASMTTVFRRSETGVFGGIDGHPLELVFDDPPEARYVRIVLPGIGYLHLDQVEVYARD